MIFDFFKRLFGLVDEGTRKRRPDTSDAEYPHIPCAKKARSGNHRNSLPVYTDENDEDIQILDDYDYTVSKDLLNGAVYKRKIASQIHQQVPGYRRNTSSLMNGKEAKSRNLSIASINAMSNADGKYSTLSTTNRLREKQEYEQLIQNTVLQRIHVIRNKPEDETKRRQTTEIIDLDTPTKNVTDRQKPRELSTSRTPSTSTPVRWYTPSGFPPLKANHEFSSRRMSFGRGVSSTPKPGTSTNRVEFTNDLSVLPKKASPEKSEASTSDITSPRNHIEILSTNTLRDNLSAKAVMKQDFVPRVSGHYNERRDQRLKEALELEHLTKVLSKYNRLTREAALEEQLARSMRLSEAVLDETEEEEEAPLPTLTPLMQQEIKNALIPNPSNDVLVESFGLRITRKDIYTLHGLNWLNDEVINFYMNLLIARGASGSSFPKVHAMNTFFYPKLLSGGHSSLKRWTRKIDIFEKDLLVVPIHLGIHWCMSVVDFRDKTIRYFDSMGGSNPKCLSTLRQYLEDESMDKKKKSYPTNDWKLISPKDIPQQMNGSDCGVFSCMFAEFICADRTITFTQQDMPYFRNKMVYEILKSELL